MYSFLKTGEEIVKLKRYMLLVSPLTLLDLSIETFKNYAASLTETKMPDSLLYCK